MREEEKEREREGRRKNDCITFCKVRHGDSVTKPDYYNYYYYYCSSEFWPGWMVTGFYGHENCSTSRQSTGSVQQESPPRVDSVSSRAPVGTKQTNLKQNYIMCSTSQNIQNKHLVSHQPRWNAGEFSQNGWRNIKFQQTSARSKFQYLQSHIHSNKWPIFICLLIFSNTVAEGNRLFTGWQNNFSDIFII